MREGRKESKKIRENKLEYYNIEKEKQNRQIY
jgi:hypothetical protein